MGKQRFQKYFPQYEIAAQKISKDKDAAKDPNGYMREHTYSQLAYIVLAYKDQGVPTIEFFVGVFGPPPRHTVYIYRENGKIEDGSKTAERWRHREQVAENWFRVHD